MGIQTEDLGAIVDEGKRHGAALVAAVVLGDLLVAMLAARRLGSALDRVRSARARTPELPPEAVESAAAALEVFQRTLDATPRTAPSVDWARLLRWFQVQSLSSPGDAKSPHLFESVAIGKHLGLLGFEQLRLVDCRFPECALVSSVFDGAILETCDLSRAGLARTSWNGARAIRCSLAGAEMADALMNETRFVECDLRGANLACTARGMRTSTRVQFIRCDLRETNWNARMLAGARFEDCRMFGVQGRAVTRGVEVERPDVSAAGDGSRVGAARDVLAVWNALRLPGDRGMPRLG